MELSKTMVPVGGKESIAVDSMIQIFDAAATFTFTESAGFIGISARGERDGVTTRDFVGKTLIDEIEYRLEDRVGADGCVRALRAAAHKALEIEPITQGLCR